LIKPIKPLEYLDIKRSLESVKAAIENLSAELQINMLVLDMLEEEIKLYPVPIGKAKE